MGTQTTGRRYPAVLVALAEGTRFERVSNDPRFSFLVKAIFYGAEDSVERNQRIANVPEARVAKHFVGGAEGANFVIRHLGGGLVIETLFGDRSAVGIDAAFGKAFVDCLGGSEVARELEGFAAALVNGTNGALFPEANSLRNKVSALNDEEFWNQHNGAKQAGLFDVTYRAIIDFLERKGLV